MILTGWRRVLSDLKKRKFLDVYSVSFVAFTLAVLSLVPDIVPDPLRWAVLLAGVGILVLRITIPEPVRPNADEFLYDRFAFDKIPFPERLQNAAEVWVFAPSAVNVLSAHSCEVLRSKVLSKSEGIVRVVVLDPSKTAAIDLAIRQLDDSLDYPIQEFADSLRSTVHQLNVMSAWPISGSFGYRFLDYNPGFSLVAINPSARDGHIIVEFHGFHNEATSSRMHIELSRLDSDHWYSYWIDQFSRIWESASIPSNG